MQKAALIRFKNGQIALKLLEVLLTLSWFLFQFLTSGTLEGRPKEVGGADVGAELLEVVDHELADFENPRRAEIWKGSDYILVLVFIKTFGLKKKFRVFNYNLHGPAFE